jgi:hypothetical protein
MPLAEKRLVVHAISEIDQEFLAVGASEARRVIQKTQLAGRHGEAAVLEGRSAHAALLQTDKSGYQRSAICRFAH